MTTSVSHSVYQLSYTSHILAFHTLVQSEILWLMHVMRLGNYMTKPQLCHSYWNSWVYFGPWIYVYIVSSMAKIAWPFSLCCYSLTKSSHLSVRISGGNSPEVFRAYAHVAVSCHELCLVKAVLKDFCWRWLYAEPDLLYCSSGAVPTVFIVLHFFTIDLRIALSSAA